MLKNVPSGGYAELLVNPGDGPTLITNMDTSATLVLGKDNSVLAKTIAGGFQAGGDISLIHPSGSRVVDGRTAVYGIGTQASGTILVDVHQGAEAAPASATEIVSQLVLSTLPALVASAVQAAGVPPIDAPAAIEILINQQVAAGATFTAGPFSVGKYQSWFATMACGATSSGTGTNPFTKFTMAWSVASDNFDPLITHDWVVPNTPFNFFYNYRNDGKGPIFGDSLTLSWKNYDSQPMDIIIGIFGSFRTRSRANLVGRYHYVTATGAPDDTRGLASDNIVDIYNPTGLPIAPGSAANTDLMNMIDGPATISANVAYSAAGQADYQLVILFQPNSVVGAGYTIQQRGTAVAPGIGQPEQILLPTPIMLPRRVCTIQLINLATSVGSIASAQAVITAQQQPE